MGNGAPLLRRGAHADHRALWRPRDSSLGAGIGQTGGGPRRGGAASLAKVGGAREFLAEQRDDPSRRGCPQPRDGSGDCAGQPRGPRGSLIEDLALRLHKPDEFSFEDQQRLLGYLAPLVVLTETDRPKQRLEADHRQSALRAPAPRAPLLAPSPPRVDVTYLLRPGLGRKSERFSDPGRMPNSCARTKLR
jgi:hypothetical protein